MARNIPDNRPSKPFHRRFTVSLPDNPNLDVPSAPIFQSPMLDPKGHTAINAFVSMRVVKDSFPNGAITINSGLTAAAGDFGVGVRRTIVDPGQVGYEGPATYDVGVVARTDALVSGARWGLWAAAEAPPGANRMLELEVDGVLVAGGPTDRT